MQILDFLELVHMHFNYDYVYLQEMYSASTIPSLDKERIHTENIKYRLVGSNPLYKFTLDVFTSLQLQLNTNMKMT